MESGAEQGEDTSEDSQPPITLYSPSKMLFLFDENEKCLWINVKSIQSEDYLQESSCDMS